MLEFLPNLLCILMIFVVLILPAWMRMQWVEWRARSQQAEAIAAGRHEPVTIQPWVDPAMCMGSAACVKACPENVLQVIDGQAVVVDAAACVGHAACVAVCPVDAIELVFGSEKRGVDLPEVEANFQSNVPGLYVAGELGGMGLIANAVEQGAQAMTAIADGLKPRKDRHDVVIIGAGPAGVSAALVAKQRGLRYLVLEQDDFGGAIRHYPRKKLVFSRPMELRGYGKVSSRSMRKEQLIELFEDVIRKCGIEIRTEERVESVTPLEGDGFQVRTTKGTEYVQRVLLAIGRRGTPRRLNVPGEDQEKVAYWLSDPELYRNNHILVVGGGDSAIEAAISLGEQPGNRVWLSYRKDKITRPKKKNLERLRASVRRAQVELVLNSNVQRIGIDRVVLEQEGEELTLPNDFIFIFAGGVLPTGFLREAGVRVRTHYGKQVARGTDVGVPPREARPEKPKPKPSPTPAPTPSPAAPSVPAAAASSEEARPVRYTAPEAASSPAAAPRFDDATFIRQPTPVPSPRSSAPVGPRSSAPVSPRSSAPAGPRSSAPVARSSAPSPRGARPRPEAPAQPPPAAPTSRRGSASRTPAPGDRQVARYSPTAPGDPSRPIRPPAPRPPPQNPNEERTLHRNSGVPLPPRQATPVPSRPTLRHTPAEPAPSAPSSVERPGGRDLYRPPQPDGPAGIGARRRAPRERAASQTSELLMSRAPAGPRAPRRPHAAERPGPPPRPSATPAQRATGPGRPETDSQSLSRLLLGADGLDAGDEPVEPAAPDATMWRKREDFQEVLSESDPEISDALLGGDFGGDDAHLGPDRTMWVQSVEAADLAALSSGPSPADLREIERLLRRGEHAQAVQRALEHARASARAGDANGVLQAATLGLKALEADPGQAKPDLIAEQRADLWILQAEAQAGTQAYEAALESLELALRATGNAGAPKALTKVLGALGRTLAEAGQPGLSEIVVEECWYRVANPHAARASAARTQAALHLARGEPEAAERHFAQALDLARAAASPEGEARTRRGLADLRATSGRLDDALDLLARARSLLGGDGDVRILAGVLWRTSELNAALGRYGVVLQDAEALLELARKRRLSPWIPLAAAQLGEALVSVGFQDIAEDAARLALDGVKRAGFGPDTWRSRVEVARLLSAVGWEDQVEPLLAPLDALPQEPLDDPPAQLAAARARALAQSDPRAARELAADGLTRPAAAHPIRHVRTQLDLAWALLHAKDPAGAREAVKRGLQALQEIQAPGARLELLLALHTSRPEGRVRDAIRRTAERLQGELHVDHASSFRQRPLLRDALGERR